MGGQRVRRASDWRSVKYEDVYLRAYETPTELRAGLARYFEELSTTPGAVTAHWTDAPPMRCTSTRLTAIWQPETRGRFHLPHCPIPGVHFSPPWTGIIGRFVRRITVTTENNRRVFQVTILPLIGIGGHLTVPPLPHHRAYGSVPRRFVRIKPQQGSRVWGGRASRNGGCVGLDGPPRVGPCASTPSASQRRWPLGTLRVRGGGVP